MPTAHPRRTNHSASGSILPGPTSLARSGIISSVSPMSASGCFPGDLGVTSHPPSTPVVESASGISTLRTASQSGADVFASTAPCCASTSANTQPPVPATTLTAPSAPSKPLKKKCGHSIRGKSTKGHSWYPNASALGPHKPPARQEHTLLPQAGVKAAGATTELPSCAPPQNFALRKFHGTTTVPPAYLLSQPKPKEPPCACPPSSPAPPC